MLFFLLWESFLNYLLEQEIKSQEIKQVQGPLFSAVRAHSLAGGVVSTQRMKAAWQLQEYLWQSEKRGRKAATQRARESLGCQNSQTSKRFTTVGETRVPIETSVKTKAKFSRQKSINLQSNGRVQMFSTQGQAEEYWATQSCQLPEAGTEEPWSPEGDIVTDPASADGSPTLPLSPQILWCPSKPRKRTLPHSHSFPWTPNQAITHF